MKDPRPRDDVFDTLADELETDPDFCSAAEEFEAAAAAPTEEVALEITQSYEVVPIDKFGAQLHEAFINLCKSYRVDIHSTDWRPADYIKVNTEIARLAYQMKDMLWAGDTFAASCALAVILDPQGDREIGVIPIGSSQRIIGQFVDPFIAPMPDDTHAITQDSSAPLACGVGIRIKNPVLFDKQGEQQAIFDGAQAIIPLGTAGLQLEKFMPYYNDNF